NRGIGPYTYMPEMYDRAKEIALARDPNTRRPIFGKTVHDYAQQHMMSADDLLADMAKNLSVMQGKPYEFTRPTEWSGRVLQKGVAGATAAAPALVAGPAGLSAVAASGASSAAGQGAREVGLPEGVATAIEVGGSLLSPAEIA